MVKKFFFWYRRILTMAVITLSMVLFSYIYIKQQRSDTLEANYDGTEIFPCGFSVGIYLETDGVLVVGTDVITGSDGLNYDPSSGIVKEGDYIMAVNDINVSAKSQLGFLLNKYGSKPVTLRLLRDGEEINVKITPICVGEEQYKIGVWVKDDSQGIGTMTYIMYDGSFGALGHGISDADTKKLLSAENGRIYEADIWGITKGRSGSPGSLCGSINYDEKNIIAAIEENCAMGIYGNLKEYRDILDIIDEYDLQPMEVCNKKDVKLGKAYIRTAVNGEIKDYEIEITDIDIESEGNKGMVIEVNDEKLLELTGGIVQGMSGSPIIQNGRIVGAVTHVLVNDPTRGYGIFIENMLEH